MNDLNYDNCSKHLEENTPLKEKIANIILGMDAYDEKATRVPAVQAAQKILDIIKGGRYE